jgi:hypothetical protein
MHQLIRVAGSWKEAMPICAKQHESLANPRLKDTYHIIILLQFNGTDLHTRVGLPLHVAPR